MQWCSWAAGWWGRSSDRTRKDAVAIPLFYRRVTVGYKCGSRNVEQLVVAERSPPCRHPRQQSHQCGSHSVSRGSTCTVVFGDAIRERGLCSRQSFGSDSKSRVLGQISIRATYYELNRGQRAGDEQRSYGACPKNETCAFSGRLTHHCTVAGGAGYEKILNWPPWKEPLPRRS